MLLSGLLFQGTPACLFWSRFRVFLRSCRSRRNALNGLPMPTLQVFVFRPSRPGLRSQRPRSMPPRPRSRMGSMRTPLFADAATGSAALIDNKLCFYQCCRVTGNGARDVEDHYTIDRRVRRGLGGTPRRPKQRAFPGGLRDIPHLQAQGVQGNPREGLWVREATGARHSTLNRFNKSIASGNESVWNGNWKYPTPDGSFRSIDSLLG